MKKIILLSGLLIGSFCLIQPATAQVHVNVNIGVQPAWGPAGYNYAAYYYLPDIEAYYSVSDRQFTYFDDGRWTSSTYLPGRCANYDLYSGYKVVINGRNPWNHFYDDRSRYSAFRYRHDQVVISDRRGFGGGDYGRPYYEDRRDRRWGNDNDNRRDRDYRDRDNDRGWGHDRDDNRGHNRDDDHGRGRDRDRDHDNGHGHGRGRW
jgi:hypothetical protein